MKDNEVEEWFEGDAVIRQAKELINLHLEMRDCDEGTKESVAKLFAAGCLRSASWGLRTASSEMLAVFTGGSG